MFKCTAEEAKMSKCEEDIKKAIRESNATLGVLRLTLERRDASTGLYPLAPNLAERLSNRKCEEAWRKLTGTGEGAAESEKAVCGLEHKSVDVFIHRNFTQASAQKRHSNAGKVILEILKRAERLIRQRLFGKSGIRESLRKKCSILRQIASVDRSNNDMAAEEKPKRLEGMHRSIWKRRDKAQGLSQEDELFHENERQLALALAELKKAGEYHYHLAEIQLRDVWDASKRSSTFGPTHDDTVDSALQLASTWKEQKKEV
jgi:hypothetical protein